MHIFDKFVKIPSYQYQEICDSIKKQRNTEIRKNLLDGESKSFSFEDFQHTTDIPHKFNININAWTFDCLFNFINNHKLYIILSGYKNAKDSVPLFKRWSWNYAFDGSVLYISDPMLRKYKNLSLGWYYGSSNDCLYEYISNIVRIINKKFNFTHNIFYGSSGGGYAALQASTYMENTFSVAINPQIDIKNFSYTNAFITCTGINLYENDKFDRNNLINRLVHSKSNFLIIQNDTDSVHVINHLIPLMKKYAMQPQYGIQKNKNLFVWLYHAFENHNAQENKIILQFILYIVDKLIKHQSIPNEIKKLSIAVNEIWAQLFWLSYCVSKQHE